ncbi:MAG: pyrroloquinoline quinone biosynthesis peptide chaperone PqqD [Nocardiopsaceae bacterium]|nr:pyrroloquinoline quinone biosynthesis peptide chaperone PqqD [Nocardiopsaceae bacterium]
MPTPTSSRPKLAPHVRLAYDKARGKPVLLAPESVTTLNETGAAIAGLCDGTRTVEQITAALADRFDDVDDGEVRAFIERLAAMRCLRAGQPGETT